MNPAGTAGLLRLAWRGHWSSLLAAVVLGTGAGTDAAAEEVAPTPIWTRYERTLISESTYENPVQEVMVEAEFSAPSGAKHTVEAFWAGDKTWKIRFSPDEIGRWSYTTRCTPSADGGLGHQSGAFDCVAYRGTNPLYRHGALRVSANGRYFEHADGIPFFWLGDTTWSGMLKSTDADWEEYLDDRVAKGFTVIQTIGTHWNTTATDIAGRPSYTGIERIAIDPGFFDRLDRRQDAINARGLISSTILAHDSGKRGASPGIRLSDDQLLVLVRYLVARYGANQAVWSLSGDRLYRFRGDDRWKSIGRAVFGHNRTRLVTLHAGPKIWIADDFRDEPWFSFNGYQSSHWDREEFLQWLCEGPPSQDWRKEPPRPYINLEPNYEDYKSYDSHEPFDAAAVRRAAYWSLLVTPTAGVGYGAHGLWDWALTAQEPANHEGTGTSRTWREAMQFPGSTQMKYLAELFTSLRWWELRPAQELLEKQPGSVDHRHFVMAAQGSDHGCALVYIPAGDAITIHTGELVGAQVTRWYDPRLGRWGATTALQFPEQTFTPPDDGDWVLWMGRRTQP